MNSKMTTDSQLSTNEPKKKKNNKNKNYANNYNRNRIREMDNTWRVFCGEGEGWNGGEERYREEAA